MRTYREKRCSRCHSEFTPTGPRNVYCLECRQAPPSSRARLQPRVAASSNDDGEQLLPESRRRRGNSADPKLEAAMHLRLAVRALRRCGLTKTAAVVEVFAARFD